MSTVKTTITKDYLARQLSYRNDISKEMGKKIIDHITEILADALAHGNEVEIRGLMSMTPYMSKAERDTGSPPASRYLPASGSR
jgi:nucleoid DNA-binding protein